MSMLGLEEQVFCLQSGLLALHSLWVQAGMILILLENKRRTTDVKDEQQQNAGSLRSISGFRTSQADSSRAELQRIPEKIAFQEITVLFVSTFGSVLLL